MSGSEIPDPRIAYSWHIGQDGTGVALNGAETRSEDPGERPLPPLPRRVRPAPQMADSREHNHPKQPDPPIVSRAPGEVRGRLLPLRREYTQLRRSFESASEALQRQAEPELLNEILAGGAIAASVTAAATVAKAKIDANTQRLRDAADAEIQRLKIESDERVAKFQATKAAQSARYQARQQPDD
ncbi:hypothetical protein ACIGXG_35455 [Streptomyces goshikiensis]|uniref:hypothetical protein n=1 Tax=Streptomyces goshikiensis TaxID=1942 RepID=UPI0037CF184B